MAIQICKGETGIRLQCCDEPTCGWCAEGTGEAGEIVTIEFEFDPAAENTDPVQCEDCAAYNSGSYELARNPDCNADAQCCWEGPGECGHWMKLFYQAGLDNQGIRLQIWSSEAHAEAETFGELLAGFLWEGEPSFDCTAGFFDMEGGFLIDPVFLTPKGCLGTGIARMIL